MRGKGIKIKQKQSVFFNTTQMQPKEPKVGVLLLFRVYCLLGLKCALLFFYFLPILLRVCSLFGPFVL
jgi:hypothetical protein